MLTHNLLDSITSLVGVVERDSANVVVKDVSLDNSVQKLTTNKAKFTIDCGSCTTGVGPLVSGVVGEGWVGVLKESDSNYKSLAKGSKSEEIHKHTEPVVNP